MPALGGNESPVASLRTIALALAFWATPVAMPQDARRTAAPTWVWKAPGAIEWAAPVQAAERAMLLIATAGSPPRGDTRLQLVDASTGKPLLAEPIRVAPGVQPATPLSVETNDVVCCFDRYALQAIRIRDPVDLAWQHGKRPADPRAFRDDPETLSGWVAAAGVPDGMLAVNRDGRVILCSSSDGTPRWSVDLGPLPVSRLHVSGGAAVVLWKARGVVRAAFLDTRPERPVPTIRELGATWPLWSTLTSRGLVTASHDEVVNWPPEGASRPLDVGARGFRAAAIGMCTLEPPGAARLVFATDFRVHCLDLIAHSRCWTRDVCEADACIVAVDCRDDRVIVTSSQERGTGAVLIDVRTGRLLQDCRSPAGTRLIAAGAADGRLWGLYRRTDAAAGLLLVEGQTADSAAPPGVTARFAPPLKLLDSPPEPRGALWLDQQVILVGRDALHAYTLPPASMLSRSARE